MAGANLDNAALPGVYVAVVMGRHAGFLTAASALGRKYDDDGPHLIYLREREFSVERFLADVKATYDRLGRCIVAVSEGIHDASGQPIAAQLAKDLERDVDQREARDVGEKAVQYGFWSGRDGSVAIRRTGRYAAHYTLLPLSEVDGRTRTMEDDPCEIC